MMDYCLIHAGTSVKEAHDRIQRRLALIREHLPDTATAFNWLREHRGMFKGKIHGPIGMMLNIKDARYATMVESILGGIRGQHLRVCVLLLCFIIAMELTLHKIDICM